MENKDKVIGELFTRLEQLMRQQKVFQEEIQKLNDALRSLKDAQTDAVPPPEARSMGEVRPVPAIEVPPTPPATSLPADTFASAPARAKTPWEEFIGRNLLNKVGIAVLIAGIGIGAKYSIDHELINPLTRIVLGYLSGIALLGIAFRLKRNYPGFSAVMLSGGMAVLYFITYAAYDFYGLIPQALAFALMVMFTVFTVLASLQYNLEVIGIIGLVGAYAVPFLLSEGRGQVVILFSYISIINTGILFLSFRKYWKRLYYLAFALTWLSFATWYAMAFRIDEHAAVSLIFSTIFFLIFYATFLAYKLVRKEALGRLDVLCMLLNSFIYFGYGYLTLDTLEHGSDWLGVFTLLTALMHFVACVIIYRNQDGFSDIFYFTAGLVLVFVTIAAPVQLEGNWVTLIWATEATLLFWIGRSKNFPVYEKLSYPLVILAFLSVLHDWSNHYPDFYYYAYESDADFTIFLNVHFMTSMLVGIAFAIILRIASQYPDGSAYRPDARLNKLLWVALPLLTLLVLYGGFYKEIEAFWNNRHAASRIVIQAGEGIEHDQYNSSVVHFKGVWLLIYSALFASVLCVVQLRYRTAFLAGGCLMINTLVLLFFLTSGLLDLSALRFNFLTQDLAQYYERGYGHILIRYVAITAMLPLLWFNWRLARRQPSNEHLGKTENLFFHFAVLTLLSSELIHWLDMARVENSFKLSLSILWGAYALFLIALGLSRDQKHIRLAAIVLFAATLLKLFAYDMSDMSTILKTVVMIILGGLLLMASFIYNKYKERSSGNETH